MVLSKPCALVYTSLLLFLLLLFFSEGAFARLPASSKSKEKTELDLLMDFGSDKVTRSLAGQVRKIRRTLTQKKAGSPRRPVHSIPNPRVRRRPEPRYGYQPGSSP